MPTTLLLERELSTKLGVDTTAITGRAAAADVAAIEAGQEVRQSHSARRRTLAPTHSIHQCTTRRALFLEQG